MGQFRCTRQRVGYGAIFAGTFFGLLATVFSLSHSVNAATGINQQVSYQARLLDNTGAAVPDGTYNMEFKIYQDGDGVLAGGDETLKWTETRTGGNKVTVKNGYFAVMLGAVNAFNASVDWNQDTLWLSTNIGGTGTPTWDGEMSPFRRLAAAPYALNANRIGGLTASQLLQLAPTSVQTDSGTTSSIFLNKTGASGNILQLQKNGTDVLSINNSGLATFGSGISVGAETVTDLSGNGLVVSSNTLAVRLDTTPADGSTTSSASGLEFVSGELSLLRGCAANEILKWDNTNFEWDCAVDQSGGGSADLDIAYDNDSDKVLAIDSTSGLLLNMTTTGDFSVQDNGVSVLTVNDNGTMLFKPSADNAAAFEVQKSGSTTQLFIIDSSNDRVYIGDDSADGTGALLVLDSKNTTGNPNGVNGAMYYNAADHTFRCYRGVNATAADGVWEECATNPIDRAFVLEDDFLGGGTAAGTIGSAGWNPVTIGTACTVTYGQATPAPTADRPGVLRCATAATINTGTAMILGTTTGGSAVIAPGMIIKTAGAVGSATTTTNTLRIGAYASTTNTQTTTSGVWWEADPTLNANWRYCYANGSAATCAASGTAIAANTFARLEIRVTAVGSGTSAADFFVNGTKFSVSSATINTATRVFPSFTCYTQVASAQNCFMDYYQIRTTAGTAR